MSRKRTCSKCAYEDGWVRWRGSRRRQSLCQIAQAAEYAALGHGLPAPIRSQFSCALFEKRQP